MLNPLSALQQASAAIAELELTRAEFRVLLHLARYADCTDGDHFGECWPTLQSISRTLCLDERNVRRAIRRLEQRGHLETRLVRAGTHLPRMKLAERRDRPIYRLRITPWGDSQWITGTPGERARGGRIDPGKRARPGPDAGVPSLLFRSDQRIELFSCSFVTQT